MISFLKIRNLEFLKAANNPIKSAGGNLVMTKTYQVIYSATADEQTGSGVVTLDNEKTVTYTALFPNGTDWRKNYRFNDAQMVGISSNIDNCQINKSPYF